MKRKYRRKSRATARALKLRGGYAMPRTVPRPYNIALPKGKSGFNSSIARAAKAFKSKPSFKNANTLYKQFEKTLTSEGRTWGKYLLSLAASKTSVEIGKQIIKRAAPPLTGVSTSADEIPTTSDISTHYVSGKNGLYHSREHRIKFFSGNNYGRWMRNIIKTDGIQTLKRGDTTETLGLGSTDRANLTYRFGAGQKGQVKFLDSVCGFRVGEITPLFDLAGLDTSTTADQTAYGAISMLRSQVTVTSLNKFVPMYVKFYLLKAKDVSATSQAQFDDCCNSDINIQQNGRMPRYFQQTAPTVTTHYHEVKVDPKTRGVRAADNWETAFEIVQSRTVKLSAGDRVKVDYMHLLMSGVRLDNLYNYVKSPDFSTDHPICYTMMMEVWGEEVDIQAFTDANQTIKATSPGVVQFEFAKWLKGVRNNEPGVDYIDSDPQQGWKVGDFAVKVYTRKPVIGTTRRWNSNYSNLNQNNASGYKVPIMSDATEGDGGQIT